MRNVTHLSSDNILPVNIFNLYENQNINKKQKQVIFKKTYRYVNGGGGGGGEDDDTNNMCREILVEPLSDIVTRGLQSTHHPPTYWHTMMLL